MTSTRPAAQKDLTDDSVKPVPGKNRPLLWAALAAVGASVCCLGPLVLVTVGITGAWISYLPKLEPLRPVFIAIALVFLFLAFRKLYLVPRQCTPAQACADPKVLRRQRLIFWIASVAVLALLSFPYYGTSLLK